MEIQINDEPTYRTDYYEGYVLFQGVKYRYWLERDSYDEDTKISWMFNRVPREVMQEKGNIIQNFKNSL
jgi:hypothetical protein